MLDEITKEIIGYTEDEGASSLFAISLYGEWGSGKTYYCKNVLAPALKDAGCTMLRVSLFGVATYEEIFSRMLSALCRVDKPRIQSLMKSLGRSLLSMVDSYLGVKGIRLDLNAETIISAMSMEKTLIVLDDTERSAFAGEMNDLLGLVNDMVENHRWHIMLVRNEPFDLTNSEAEKVISRQFEYLPTAEDLYDAIMTHSTIADEIDFDFKAAVISGMKSAGKLNARGLARIVPTLNQVCSSSIMHSNKIAPEGRMRALKDVVRFSISVAVGDPPSEPNKKTESKQGIDFALAGIDWEKYQSLSEIVKPIGYGKLASMDTIDGCMGAYIAKEYPDSPADMEVKTIYDSWRQADDMDDADVSNLAAKLAMAITRHDFSLAWLYRAWKMNRSLNELGFNEALKPDDAKACYEEKARENPLAFYAQLHHEYSIWAGMEGMARDTTLEQVINDAKGLINESLNRTSGAYRHELINEDSGKLLAEKLEAMLNDPLPTILSIPPDYIASCFICGNAISQNALHQFFQRTLSVQFRRIEDDEELLVWLNNVLGELKTREIGTRMGRLRLGWLTDDIEGICRDIESAGATHCQTR